ncbi:hypothetical protein ACWOB4_12845 [Enterococcus songbeiensis]
MKIDKNATNMLYALISTIQKKKSPTQFVSDFFKINSFVLKRFKKELGLFIQNDSALSF